MHGPWFLHIPSLQQVTKPVHASDGSSDENKYCSQRRRTESRVQKMPKRACRVRPLFTGQNPQSSRRCEEGRHRATHGGAAGNRISADAVGRRSPSLRGRVLVADYASPRPRRDGDAGSPAGRARRPGLESRGRIPRPSSEREGTRRGHSSFLASCSRGRSLRSVAPLPRSG